MRVFFALEFDKELKKEMKNNQELIIKRSLKGNFTAEDNFHLTLKYIGEIKEGQLELLKDALLKVSRIHEPMNLIINGLGYFPRGNKKILWFGLNKNDKLSNLYNSLEIELESRGFVKEDRPYSPHITLGREVILNEDFNKLANEINFSKEVSINKVSLMESTRINGKLTYLPVYSVNL